MLQKELNKVKIGFLPLVSISEKSLLAFLVKTLESKRKTFVVTANPEFFVYGQKKPWFAKILKKADLVIPDGMGLIWAGKILNRPIKERISGTDLMEDLCRTAAKKGWKVGLIGGEKGVAQRTLSVLKKRYPELKGWAKSGPRLVLKNCQWNTKTRGEIEKTVKTINSQKPTLLFVAFGMGKQEKFIADNWQKLNVKLAMGVGGAFDYLSVTVPRAPKWMQKTGLEWLYRLFRQPWRWKRQLRLAEFGWLILQERLSKE